MTKASTCALVLVLLFGVRARPAQAVDPSLSPAPVPDPISLTSDAVEPIRFIAVHGQRSVILGYPQKGLEIWGYPFQILSDYQVSFKAVGSAAATDGRLLLRRVVYRPDSITRIYIGPDYLVRENLFVPLDQAAAVISYQVEGIRQVEMEVRFQPVLNLMWPGAVGGQYIRWNGDAQPSPPMPGFVLNEPEHGYSGAIGSPELISHDDTVNSTIHPESSLHFSLRPRAPRPGAAALATVYVALNLPGTKSPSAALQTLSNQLPQMQQAAAAHYSALTRRALRIHTPDQNVNRTLAWSVIALDQAWVCNPLLGCGLVAGYGPSRDARRPQYAWFFGGDGLVATNALLAAGEYSRAREELMFIQNYQDPASGMIWHELSQSAGLIDWSKYPYMYVHVDISFDYLATLARYVSVTGDIDFVNTRWASVAAAFRYCQSQINAGDHLPHIPADKEASDEQHRPADDLALAASWIAAASGYQQLSTLTGHVQQADQARKEVELTSVSIPGRYWNARAKFWFDGHTASGEPIFRQAAGPAGLMVQNAFPLAQRQAILDRLASADFQTDWGTREVAATSEDYNPYSYGAGSVSALGTSAIATSLWQAHRPESALGLWHGILQWSTLDSLGHIHEVTAGNFFHEETESVPEQTWSSAGLLDCTVRGLLGLEVSGTTNYLRLAPHLPVDWNQVAVDNIRLSRSTISVKLSVAEDNVDLVINNEGSPASLVFEPQIPLGSRLLNADYNNARIEAEIRMFPGDQHARVTLPIPSGVSHCRLRFSGGISMLPASGVLHVGNTSSQPKIIGLSLQDNLLSINADVLTGVTSRLRIRTPWLVAARQGINVHSLPGHEYELEITPPSGSESTPIGTTGYVHSLSRLTVAPQ